MQTLGKHSSERETPGTQQTDRHEGWPGMDQASKIHPCSAQRQQDSEHAGVSFI